MTARIPSQTPLFRDHPRRWREHRYVYPVISRRSQGLSIGVNLNPDQACNFDCVYCSVDRRVPSTLKTVDPTLIRDELHHLLELVADGSLFHDAPFDRTPLPLRRLNDIAFSGDGEPTTYGDFAGMCHLAVELLEWHRQEAAKVVVITNATMLHLERVQAGFDVLGQRAEIWAKLDAGTEDYYRQVDRSGVPLRRILEQLLATGLRRPLVIQALFARLHGELPQWAEITAWGQRLAELRTGGAQISRIQVYTTARTTAEPWVTALSEAELNSIAEVARSHGLLAEVYP